jgi:glycosyltransferase family protein
MRVIIFGRGKGLQYIGRCLLQINVVAYIDNFTLETVTDNGTPIIRQEEIDIEYDYIIVSLFRYETVRDELISIGVNPEKIICFFDIKDSENSSFYRVFDREKWKNELDQKNQQEIVKPRSDNLYYEKNADELLRTHQIPHIIDAEKTIDLIINTKKSLSRFGDGEFEIILGRTRPRFQSIDRMLGEKLKSILQSNYSKHLVAIADNYGDLSKYTMQAADGIRQYLSPKVRKEHMSLLDMQRDYYDAYLSRPYIIYDDKSAEVMIEKFSHLKKIWDDKDVLLIEGKHTRAGVGNDLFDNVSSMIRILAPDKEAFSVYDNILKVARSYANNRLVMSILGPTATILSYDLSIEGYWAIDIGQVDTEYEWYIRGVSERCDVSYKTISEYTDKSVYGVIREPFKSRYEKQIVAVIE